VTAVAWFQKAANQGGHAGLFNLGTMYAKGMGVPQDYVLAHMWFNLAAGRVSTYPDQNRADKRNSEDLVRKEIQKKRDAIAKKMTPAQIAEPSD
jgi:TPR repeat protein